MKISSSHSHRTLIRPWVIGLLVTGATVFSLQAADPDLPFSSGSTGADGALKFKEIIPGGRAYVSMAYFPPTQKIILFGGYSNSTDVGETWEFDGTNWKRLFPANSPSSRRDHRMVFDAERNEIVMFGGFRNASGNLNETWVWKDNNWTQKNPETSPSARNRPNLAFDGAAGRRNVVLFGGDSANDDTWLWNGSNWTLAATSVRPPNYAGVGITFDAARNEVVMFNNAADTWIWNGTAWSNRASADRPSGRGNHRLAYDPIRQEVILFGGDNRSDTWSWNGVNWTPENPTTVPPQRATFGFDWHPGLQRLVAYGGYTQFENPATDTWFWNGTNWANFSGSTQWFDLAAAPANRNGRFDFTTIEVPSGITVRFLKDAVNSPVRWLATGDVVINGVIDVSGERALQSFAPGQVAQGGPGGYAGGARGVRFDASSSYVGGAGQGPGGGLPGTQPITSPQNLRDGQSGRYLDAYGNAFLQPLLGGSGGGGGSSVNTADGGSGGGGGGAILISSSRDIVINGAIRANGGDVEGFNSVGGRGSGGGILLKADRISGPGVLEAYGGYASNPNADGRIRVEAFVRTMTSVGNPVVIGGLPGANGDINNAGATLQITSVKGVGVPALPSGSLLTPDVVFSETGPVTVQVSGTGIPDGTPVNLRVTTANGVVSGSANLTAGAATIQIEIPKGLGTLQATAQFAAP
ncbi:MAG: hypothetical protein J0M24_10480 [Verrucomicrobia bacterium]|nr:hypothetical protein [Verrucomicrobiota bacterium]